MAELKLTNCNNIKKFISFKIDGLDDAIQVGIIYPNRPNNFEQALSIAYKGQVYNFPFNATSEEIKLINAQYDTSEYFNEENPLEDMFENGQQVKIGNLYADKETYEWLTTPNEEEDDISDWRENTVFTDEPDPERVKACQDIFEGIGKVTITLAEGQHLHSHLRINDLRLFFDLIEELDIKNGTDFELFQSVIQEHCINKGIYDLESIRNTWKEFKESLENVSNHVKNL